MSPTRRDLLRTGGAVLSVGLAGCNAAESPTATDPATATDTPTPTDADAGALSVGADLHRYAYALSGEPVRPQTPWSPMVRATELSELPTTAAREAVLGAIRTGRYETDDPTRAVLDGVEGVDVVAHEGSFYDVSHTFTEHVLELGESVDPSTVPASTVVSLDDERVEGDRVEDALSTVAQYGVETARSEYRTLVFTDALASFVDQYDYVRDSRGVARLRYRVVRRFPPYAITAEPATDREMYGEEVVAGDRLSDRSRALVRETLASRRPTVFEPDPGDDGRGLLLRDTVPVDMVRWLARSALLRLDGDVVQFSVYHAHWKRSPFDLSVALDAAGVGPDGPATLTLAATNVHDRTASLRMPGLPPFGILWAVPEGEGDPVQLWSPRYEESEHVAVEDGVAVPDSYAEEVRFSPGETVERTYQFGRDPGAVAPGTYTVWSSLYAKWATEPGQETYDWTTRSYPYGVTLTVTDG